MMSLRKGYRKLELSRNTARGPLLDFVAQRFKRAVRRQQLYGMGLELFSLIIAGRVDKLTSRWF
jgi:hypothetical protein